MTGQDLHLGENLDVGAGWIGNGGGGGLEFDVGIGGVGIDLDGCHVGAARFLRGWRRTWWGSGRRRRSGSWSWIGLGQMECLVDADLGGWIPIYEADEVVDLTSEILATAGPCQDLLGLLLAFTINTMFVMLLVRSPVTTGECLATVQASVGVSVASAMNFGLGRARAELVGIFVEIGEMSGIVFVGRHVQNHRSGLFLAVALGMFETNADLAELLPVATVADDLLADLLESFLVLRTGTTKSMLTGICLDVDHCRHLDWTDWTSLVDRFAPCHGTAAVVVLGNHHVH